MTYTTLIEFAKPSEFAPDALTDVLRRGARELLATAVQAEVAEFLAAHADVLDDEGRQRLVRHGSLPGREVMTGIGKVAVQVPRVRDRGADKDGSRIRFRSSLIPPYLRKSKSVEELLPWLYLKGISTGDFSEALGALLGPDAEGLSSSTITRLKAAWWDDFVQWRKRDLTTKRYVYFWADGIYFTPRLDDDRQCMLVIIGADEYGDKDVLGIMDGFRGLCQVVLSSAKHSIFGCVSGGEVRRVSGPQLRDLQTIVSLLKDKRAHLAATEQPVDTSTAAGKAFFDMLGVFAEFETNLRRERQAEGIAAAKRRGAYRGRPPRIDMEAIKERLANGLSPTDIAREMGISRGTVYKAKALV